MSTLFEYESDRSKSQALQSHKICTNSFFIIQTAPTWYPIRLPIRPITQWPVMKNTTRSEFFWRPKNTNRSCYSTGIDCRRSGCKFPKCSVIYFVGIRNSLHAMVSCKNHPILWPFNYLLCLADIELKILICSIFCGIFKYFEKLMKYLTLISAIICY